MTIGCYSRNGTETFHPMHIIYPNDLEVKDTIDTQKCASS